MPFRDCTFSIIFGYGIDDITSCLEFLKSVNRLNESGIEKIGIENIETPRDVADRIKELTKVVWYEVEETFKPKVSKY
jgi:hypothetical protein